MRAFQLSIPAWGNQLRLADIAALTRGELAGDQEHQEVIWGTYTKKGKGINCVSHVALVKMECQTAIDCPYIKRQLELTLIVRTNSS